MTLYPIARTVLSGLHPSDPGNEFKEKHDGAERTELNNNCA